MLTEPIGVVANSGDNGPVLSAEIEDRASAFLQQTTSIPSSSSLSSGFTTTSRILKLIEDAGISHIRRRRAPILPHSKICPSDTGAHIQALKTGRGRQY